MAWTTLNLLGLLLIFSLVHSLIFGQTRTFVDEILGVGDESFQKKCQARIEAFRKRGAAIMLVSHNMATVEKMCQRAAWLDHGVLKTVGEPDQVIRAYRERYG